MEEALYKFNLLFIVIIIPRGLCLSQLKRRPPPTTHTHTHTTPGENREN